MNHFCWVNKHAKGSWFSLFTLKKIFNERKNSFVINEFVPIYALLEYEKKALSIFSWKIFIFFINSESHLTQTQIVTLKLILTLTRIFKPNLDPQIANKKCLDCWLIFLIFALLNLKLEFF